jgi:Heparinase II/III-like protein/Heparinase II/III N-terminus
VEPQPESKMRNVNLSKPCVIMTPVMHGGEVRLVKRLRSMSRRELLTRCRQELNKRWDIACFATGLPFSGTSPADQRPGIAGRFFFSPIEIPALTGEFARRFPADAGKAVSRAEKICNHEFDLLGFEHVRYGRTIDWHLDAVHGKHAPRRPWFRIHYLDFDEVGDSKITWELNRHQHLVILAKAFLLTGDKRFSAELVRQWTDWQLQNPYPIGINWASSLEVALRSLSWLWIRNLLAGSSDVTTEFVGELNRALATSARHVETYLSTYFSPNTHLLGEAVALFFIGTLCPKISAAERWRTNGWDMILHEAQRQVRSDGMYFEQSTYYHVYALDFLLHARILAAANDIVIPPQFDQTIVRMLEFLATISQAGVPPRFGDDDGGRVFDPTRNRAEHLLDPLATGAALFKRQDFKAAVGEAREETLWLLGARGLSDFDSLPVHPPVLRSAAYRESGVYVMADPGDGQAIIDAGPQGALSGGHGHADALSMHFSAAGREILIDPGTCSYISEDGTRNLFRGTAAHNTLSVDNSDQSAPAGPFSWRALVDTETEAWITGDAFQLFRGSHSGYRQGTGSVVHRRWVFHLNSEFWLVRDVAVGQGQHSLDLFWHLAPDLNSTPGNSQGLLFNANGRPAFAFLTNENSGFDWRLEQGWWSPAYGKRNAAHVIHFSQQATLPAELYSLFFPVQEALPSLGRLTVAPRELGDQGISACSYHRPSGVYQMIFAEGSNTWQAGRIESDARFVCCAFDAKERLRRFVLCEGTFVRIDRSPIFSSDRLVPKYEGSVVDAGNLSSKEESVAPGRGNQ